MKIVWRVTNLVVIVGFVTVLQGPVFRNLERIMGYFQYIFPVIGVFFSYGPSFDTFHIQN